MGTPISHECSQAHRNGVPLKRKDIFFVESPKALERIEYIVYSVELETCYTHFLNGKTFPCYEDHDLCEGGHTEMNIRWKGYFLGYSDKRREPVFCQLTLDAGNQLMDQLADRTNLRGLKIAVARSKKNNGRMSCGLVETHRTLDTYKLPPVVPARRSLLNLWKLPYNDSPFTRLLDRPEDAEIRLREVS